MRYTVLQRTYLPSYVRKVQRPAVSLRTPGPTVYPSTSRWSGCEASFCFRAYGEGPVMARRGLLLKSNYAKSQSFHADLEN